MPAGVQEVRGGGWTAVAASAVGAAHAARGEPSQDAVAVIALTGAVPGVAAAVADGHGGPAYVRAAAGARCAVEVALTTAAALLPELLGTAAARSEGQARQGGQAPHDDGVSPLQRAAVARLVPAVVSGWRRAVLADAVEHPLTAAETERAGAAPDALLADPALAYGTTLLLAAAWDGGALLVQLGDGDVLAVEDGGGTTTPLGTDEQRRGGTTASLCQPRAAEEARVAALHLRATAPRRGVPAPQAHEVTRLLALATDGYGAAFADPGWRPRVGADLLALVTTHGAGAVAASLPAWLGESARVAGDDASLALLHRDRWR